MGRLVRRGTVTNRTDLPPLPDARATIPLFSPNRRSSATTTSHCPHSAGRLWTMNVYRPYSDGEEIAHSVTAAIGVAAMLVAIPWLIATAVVHGGVAQTVGAAAFGLGALL